jgi:hypothetical protein
MPFVSFFSREYDPGPGVSSSFICSFGAKPMEKEGALIL